MANITGKDAQAAALACLTGLLDGAHRATPDQLASVVADAGAAFGWELTAYLVTFDQRQLVPLMSNGRGASPFAVDSDAGRAFRTMRVVHDGDTTWTPVLDGVERLGVLRVVPRSGAPRPADHEDELRWMSMLIGHLVAVMTPHGDVFTRIRGGADRKLEAELIWNLLPPLTYASGDVIISGLLEPAERVAGDAFDYAVEGSTVDLAIFDGTGHDLSSGLLASVALAAYRNHRRRADDLVACASAIDQVLFEHTDAAGYATGVLARLDSATGVLEYLNAGHPKPLLLRGGKVVGALEHSGRPLFGLGGREVSVGQLQLEPGDQVVLYTDGIIEARDGDGTFFGLDRLTALLEQHDADGSPAPETLRLVVRDLLTRQRGVLQDDASLVFLRWAPGAGAELLPA